MCCLWLFSIGGKETAVFPLLSLLPLLSPASNRVSLQHASCESRDSNPRAALPICAKFGAVVVFFVKNGRFATRNIADLPGLSPHPSSTCITLSYVYTTNQIFVIKCFILFVIPIINFVCYNV